MVKRPGVAVFLAGALLAVLRAMAGELPAAGSPQLMAKGDSHGWVAIPVAGGGAAILHFPPRRAGGSTAESGDGAMRLAVRLPNMPERLAAWDNTVYLAFPAETGSNNKPLRPVFTMTVEAGLVAGTWTNDVEGRLPALPSLPGSGSLVGFVGTARGPLALIRGPAESTGRPRYSLMLCNSAGWRPIVLPQGWWGEEGGTPPRLELVSVAAGMEIVAVGGSNPGSWVALLPQVGDGGTVEEFRSEWKFRPLSFSAPDGTPAHAPYSPIYRVNQRLVYAARSGDGRTAELWEPSPTVCKLVQRIPGVGEDVALVAMEQADRVGLLWQEPGEETARPGTSASETRTRLAEISVNTGAILYSGPAKVGPPISPEELKLLAVALVGLMAVVLIFVLRPDAQGPALSLPRGVALAEPGRRMVAGLIDVAVAAFAASQLSSASVSDLWNPAVFFRDPAGVEALLFLIGFGWAHTTIGEWTIGRSIGKALAGCEVVHVAFRKSAEGELEVELERPSLWRAAVRNLVRWTIPPLAISGMSSLDHRHRGDLSAGTVVIVRVPDQGPAAG